VIGEPDGRGGREGGGRRPDPLRCSPRACRPAEASPPGPSELNSAKPRCGPPTSGSGSVDTGGRGRPRLPRRVPRPERRGQVDHDQDAHRGART